MRRDPSGEESRGDVYICDLSGEITEYELRQVFQNYGELTSLEHDKESASARVRFVDSKAAEEAQDVLNYALLKGRTCRCLTTSVAEVIRHSMEGGQRLVVECLDPSIESTGLRDVCGLFGSVLDCKVELDGDERSRGFGFVHYADMEGAEKAMEFMEGMQIGSSRVELRLYEHSDLGLFTGCSYVVSQEASREQARLAAAEEERQRQVTTFWKSMKYHHVEVVEAEEAKLRRLKELIQSYSPDHDRQILVIAGAAGVKPAVEVVRQCCEDTDHGSLEAGASDQDLRIAAEGFATGNLYVLVAAADVAMRDNDLGKAAMLVNMELPRTLSQYLERLHKRARKDTRVHSFFSSQADARLARPLASALEGAGHEVPVEMVEVPSAAARSRALG
ncbi:unnamed protein product [Prorocentrum cordatum]|uniref:RRM domain-containing protein n=1 Tax=Prorocentrum cordatum TaxID=2364126 RepID=A0ABN9QBK4_9DINO|nr:unnamed protein product [Polarella glacialis]